MNGQDLFAQQETNRRKSVLLVAAFLMAAAWFGLGGDLSLYLLTRHAPEGSYHHRIPWLGLTTLTVAAIMARVAWISGASKVLAASGAMELIEPVTPELKRLDNVVEEMAIAAAVPKPKIWVVPDSDPNAFATGITPDRAHLAVTSGLLEMMNRDELQGVVAHEMAHIRNLDIRLMTLLAAMVGAIALMSAMARRLLASRHSVVTGRRLRNISTGKGRPNPLLAIVLLIFWVLTLILAPIITTLLSMAVSRRREYLADATGAQFTRNPLALASALARINAAAAPTRSIPKGAAHLCIVDPRARAFAERETRFANLFASHPPLGRRLERLHAMAYRPGPEPVMIAGNAP